MSMKRVFDLVASFLLLGCLAPVMLLVALMIRFCIGSPVLFMQQRPGKNAVPFQVLKFRTMTHAVDSSGALLPDEQRLTSLGKWLRRLSLDELPQLINVLRGEMSLVGPRPLLMEYLSLYTKEQSRRHEVAPGITGWAQINGRNAIDWQTRLAMDVWYVDNGTFLLDMKILLTTVAKVFRREGISAKGEATVSKFTGGK